MDKNQILKLINFAKDRPAISALYLFGSHATGHERSGSDVDLGILFNQNVDGFTRIDLENKISKLLNFNVDLVDLQKSGPFLRHQIYKYGKSIYQDGTDFPFRFRALSIRDYLDTGYIRKIRKDLLYGQ